MKSSSHTVVIIKAKGELFTRTEDCLAVEDPLEIRLVYGDKKNRIRKNMSITMRTPGSDKDLAIGFLFTEGILGSMEEISSVEQEREDSVVVFLNENARPRIGDMERNFYATSSCGVCGKASIDAIKATSPFPHTKEEEDVPLSTADFHGLTEKLRARQTLFSRTGGIHASALFDKEGSLLLCEEDVGRHNALDKLVGKAFSKNMLPLNKHILLLSGRASFELIQKAHMAGIRTVLSIGPPSSLAVSLSQESHITLIGFLRDDQYNIYTHPQRMNIRVA